MANSLTSQDLQHGIDFTILATGTGSELNQLVDVATPVAGASAEKGVGLVITTTDTSANTPDVPNPAQSTDFNKWARYIWKRNPYVTAASQKPTLYGWNVNAVNEDATLLHWWDTSADLTQLDTDVATALTNSESANDTANAANTIATTALTTANTANATATAAATTAASAQTTANTAATSAATAATTAATASTQATTANGAAAAAQTTATAANTVANNALNGLVAKRSVKYDIAGTYSWVCPAGVTSVTTKLLGAGGGGGYGNSPTPIGSGGGSGEFVQLIGFVVVPGTAYPVVVGAGGAGASSGTSFIGVDGGDTTFNGVSGIAKGGKGAPLDTGPGAGGTGGVGTTLFDGLPGIASTGSGNGGAGGDSVQGSYGGQTSSAAAGKNAGGKGAGGGGASVAFGSGGTGGRGEVELLW